MNKGCILLSYSHVVVMKIEQKYTLLECTECELMAILFSGA